MRDCPSPAPDQIEEASPAHRVDMAGRLHQRINRVDTAGNPPVTSPTVASPPHGNVLYGTPLWAKRDATCERLVTRGPISNGQTLIKLAGGTIPRQIAQSFPQIKSPFPMNVWRDALCNRPDSALVVA